MKKTLRKDCALREIYLNNCERDKAITFFSKQVYFNMSFNEAWEYTQEHRFVKKLNKRISSLYINNNLTIGDYMVYRGKKND